MVLHPRKNKIVHLGNFEIYLKDTKIIKGKNTFIEISHIFWAQNDSLLSTGKDSSIGKRQIATKSTAAIGKKRKRC